MPDISMCQDNECPSAKKCYRYMARPYSWQSYGNFGRKPDQLKCDSFWDFKSKSEKKRLDEIA